MPQVGLEPTIPASERPQVHPLDRAVTGIGNGKLLEINRLWLVRIYYRSVRMEEMRKRQEVYTGSRSPDRDSSCDMVNTVTRKSCAGVSNTVQNIYLTF